MKILIPSCFIHSIKLILGGGSKLYKQILGVLVVLSAVTFTNIQVNAEIRDRDEYERLVVAASQSLEDTSGNKIVADTGDGYILDDASNVKFGYSYDNQGNIYFTSSTLSCPGLSLGTYYKDVSDSDGVYYDSFGVMQNPSMADSDKYRSLSELFEKTGYVNTSNKREAEEFFAYYACQYNLGKVNNFSSQVIPSDGGYRFIYPDCDKYNRDEVKRKIYNKLGITSLEGETVEEKLYNAIDLVQSNFNYDYSTIEDTVDSCLDSGRGVCIHFALIVNELLLDSGVQSEVCIGYKEPRCQGDDTHAWIRVWNGENWVYSDPSESVVTHSMQFAIIPMDSYITDYKFVRTTYVG